MTRVARRGGIRGGHGDPLHQPQWRSRVDRLGGGVKDEAGRQAGRFPDRWWKKTAPRRPSGQRPPTPTSVKGLGNGRVFGGVGAAGVWRYLKVVGVSGGCWGCGFLEVLGRWVFGGVRGGGCLRCWGGWCLEVFGGVGCFRGVLGLL